MQYNKTVDSNFIDQMIFKSLIVNLLIKFYYY